MCSSKGVYQIYSLVVTGWHLQITSPLPSHSSPQQSSLQLLLFYRWWVHPSAFQSLWPSWNFFFFLIAIHLISAPHSVFLSLSFYVYIIFISKSPQKGRKPRKLNTGQEETQETHGQLFKESAMPHGKPWNTFQLVANVLLWLWVTVPLGSLLPPRTAGGEQSLTLFSGYLPASWGRSCHIGWFS